MYDDGRVPQSQSLAPGKKRKSASLSVSPPPAAKMSKMSIPLSLDDFSYSNLMKQMASKYNKPETVGPR